MRASDENDPRVLLGELLRLARMLGPYRTQDELGPVVGLERTGVSRAESGERVPSLATADEWITACEVGQVGAAGIRAMHKLARRYEDPETVQVEPWFATESRAHTLRYWTPTVFPGIVQTEYYARSLYVAMGLKEATITERLTIRLGRQAVFGRAVPPDVTILLWEPVLMHYIGSAQVMRDQCQKLLDVPEHVNVHVLLSEVGANAGVGGAINLAATDDSPELLLSDGLVEDSLSQEPSVVHSARATFSRCRADALPRAASRRVITEYKEKWDERFQEEQLQR